MITTAGKTRVTGFHCRQLDKQVYKALRSFMELTGATTEEALQTFIQFSAHAWQLPQGRQRLTEMVQKWKNQRPREEIILHSFSLTSIAIYMTSTGLAAQAGPVDGKHRQTPHQH